MTSLVLVSLAVITAAAASLAGYLWLRLRRSERLESEHFRYLDGRIDELAASQHASAHAQNLRFDDATRRLEILEAKLRATELLHWIELAERRGLLAAAPAEKLQQQILAWRDEAGEGR